jgi:hypothetical protein
LNPNSKIKKGTHTYPLSFALPSTLPPTIHLLHSSTVYKLKASVHRPGAFIPKVKTSKEVVLVSCPVELEGEEGGAEDLGAGVGGGGEQGALDPPPAFGSDDVGARAHAHLNDGALFGIGIGGGAINVEREWESTLRYRIEFGRRKLEMGGWMDMRIMLMPLEKVRIWRIGVYLEGLSLLHPSLLFISSTVLFTIREP